MKNPMPIELHAMLPGWRLRATGPDQISVERITHQPVGYVATKDSESLASSVLFELADALIAPASPPPCKLPGGLEERALFEAALRLLYKEKAEQHLEAPLPSGDYSSPLFYPAWRVWQMRAQMPAAPVDERAAFQEAYRTLLYSPQHEQFARGTQGEYIGLHISIAWRTWQHRAMLAVWQQLPLDATAQEPAAAEGVTG